MSQRFNDRINTFIPKPKSYDAWGHLLPLEWEEVASYWAEVKPVLTAIKCPSDPAEPV